LRYFSCYDLFLFPYISFFYIANLFRSSSASRLSFRTDSPNSIDLSSLRGTITVENSVMSPHISVVPSVGSVKIISDAEAQSVIRRLRDTPDLVKLLPSLHSWFFQNLRLAFRYGPPSPAEDHSTRMKEYMSSTTISPLTTMPMARTSSVSSQILALDTYSLSSTTATHFPDARCIADVVDDEHDVGYDMFMEVLRMPREEISDEDWQNNLSETLEPYPGLWDGY
jgi:hypothetical protein